MQQVETVIILAFW